jgi:hypothetical protein
MAHAETEEKPGGARVECDRELACLNGGEGYPLCRVEKPIADLLFVTAKPLPPCRHMRFFGKGAYCTCPVRKELYKRHEL